MDSRWRRLQFFSTTISALHNYVHFAKTYRFRLNDTKRGIRLRQTQKITYFRIKICRLLKNRITLLWAEGITVNCMEFSAMHRWVRIILFPRSRDANVTLSGHKRINYENPLSISEDCLVYFIFRHNDHILYIAIGWRWYSWKYKNKIRMAWICKNLQIF